MGNPSSASRAGVEFSIHLSSAVSFWSSLCLLTTHHTRLALLFGAQNPRAHLGVWPLEGPPLEDTKDITVAPSYATIAHVDDRLIRTRCELLVQSWRIPPMANSLLFRLLEDSERRPSWREILGFKPDNAMDQPTSLRMARPIGDQRLL
jgi:hypothetical protein